MPLINVGIQPSARYVQSTFRALIFRVDDPAGAVVARLSIDNAEFWVADESPPHGNFSPESLGGGTVRLILTVEDPTAVFDRAISAGGSTPRSCREPAQSCRIPTKRPGRLKISRITLAQATPRRLNRGGFQGFE
jgi:hypothetical protein